MFIAGIPLIDRVVQLARNAISGRADVMVATDDDRIADHCRARGHRCVVTDPAIGSGSGRVLAAVRTLKVPPLFFINLQGDAPFLPPAALTGVLDALQQGHRVATPIVQLDWKSLDALRDHKRCSPFSGTTCLVTNTGRARWFSKAVLPAIRSEDAWRARLPKSPVFRHLGLYGYTLEALEQFEAATPSAYEQIEQLEQLRFFEIGINIQTVEVDPPTIPMSGIDTPQDIALAEQLIALHGDPLDL